MDVKKINLKGITAEAVSGVLILLIALINAILQMCGVNIIPINNETITEFISAAFLVITSLYNAYKNRNISTASQISQQLTDAMKDGTIAVEKVEELIAQINSR